MASGPAVHDSILDEQELQSFRPTSAFRLPSLLYPLVYAYQFFLS